MTVSKTAIGVYTPADARAIKDKVLNDNRTSNLFEYDEKKKLGWHYGILKEELLPAYCDPLAEYTQATAAVLMYDLDDTLNNALECRHQFLAYR